MSGVGVLDKAVVILAACVDGASLAELVDRTKLPGQRRTGSHRPWKSTDCSFVTRRDAGGRGRVSASSPTRHPTFS